VTDKSHRRLWFVWLHIVEMTGRRARLPGRSYDDFVRLRTAAPLVLGAALAGCGGSHSTATTATKPHRASFPFRAVLHAPTHTPKAGKPWLYGVRVTDLRGRPIRARITMRVLFSGIPVGKVDSGKTFSFVGTWREPKNSPVIWPARSRGRPLTFEAIVTARGARKRLDYEVTVK
jgi:hypothetical protein